MKTRYDYGYTQEVIEYLNTVRCKNCLFFTEDDAYESLGECSKTIDFNKVGHDIPYKGVTPEKYKNKLLSWDYEGYASGAYVGKDFGCILFKRN